MRKEQHEQEIQDFHHEVCLMRTHLRQNDAKRLLAEPARGAAASCGGAADQGNPQRISNCWNTEAANQLYEAERELQDAQLQLQKCDSKPLL